LVFSNFFIEYEYFKVFFLKEFIVYFSMYFVCSVLRNVHYYTTQVFNCQHFFKIFLKIFLMVFKHKKISNFNDVLFLCFALNITNFILLFYKICLHIYLVHSYNIIYQKHCQHNFLFFTGILFLYIFSSY